MVETLNVDENGWVHIPIMSKHSRIYIHGQEEIDGVWYQVTLEYNDKHELVRTQRIPLAQCKF